MSDELGNSLPATPHNLMVLSQEAEANIFPSGDHLLRLKTNRVFYGLPVLVRGARGRPPSHGARFQGNDPTTHTPGKISQELFSETDSKVSTAQLSNNASKLDFAH
jgi:hypothetical protein